MDWAHIANDRASDSAGLSVSTIALAYTNNVTAGDLLVVCCVVNNSKTINTPTDTQLNSWVKLGPLTDPVGTTGIHTSVYGTIAGSTGANTVTQHNSAAAACAIDLMEFSAAATTTDGTGKASAASSVTTTAATTGANELVIGGYGDNGDGTTVRAGTGFTLGPNNSPSGNTTVELIYKDSGASGATQTATWTGASTGSDALVVTVLTLSGGATNTPISASDSAAVGDAPPLNLLLGGQYALEQPTADLSAGLWTPSSGGTLFGTLNESTPDASTFDTSSTSPAGDTFEVSLGNAPVAIDLGGMPGVLNYQYQGTVTGGRRVDLTVVLLCNSAPVQTWTLPAIQSTFLIAPLQLSSAGIAAIVPGGALSLRTTATQI